MAPLPPLLMLAQRLPFPPDKGEKIRSYHVLEHLRQRFRVYLATCIDDPADLVHIPRVESMVHALHITHLDRRRALCKAALYWLAGDPLSFGYFRDRAFDAWVRDIVHTVAPRYVLCSSSNIAPAFLRSAPPQNGVRWMADFVDFDSHKWREYAALQPLWLRWLYHSEARRTHRWEARIGQSANHITFVSEEEAQLFAQGHPTLKPKLGHFGNGVDCAAFQPDPALEKPQGMGAHAIVLTGRMDYWPNRDAACWFVRDVFPAVRAVEPHAQVFIVGAEPSAEVKALSQQPGVVVTGRVPAVQPFLQHSALAIAPMRIGRGIQNKVLEAMAMGKAVLLSPEALTGIRAPDESVLCAPMDAATWRTATSTLLRDLNLRHALGQRAHDFIRHHFSWGAQLAVFDRFLGST